MSYDATWWLSSHGALDDHLRRPTVRRAQRRLKGSSGWLACGVSPDESLDAAEEGFADLYPVEKAAGRHGAIAEHDEVLRGGLGLGFLDARHQGVDRVEEP